MSDINTIFDNNRRWAQNIGAQQPYFFAQGAQRQSPQYLWIGCADSRVPPGQITGLPPGEIFVHRNIANLVVHTDLNCLSVLQYAVQVLHVEHIIVAGHYGCGGVAAALSTQERGERHGLLDNWLRHIGDIYQSHTYELQNIADTSVRCRRLCELNVIEQVNHVAGTNVVQHAWDSGQKLELHGWIYNLKNGLLHDLGISTSS